MVLPSKSIHPREVVNSLVGLHLVKFVTRHRTISPADVPVFLITVREFHVKHILGYVSDNVIFCLSDVHDEFLSFLLLLLLLCRFFLTSFLFECSFLRDSSVGLWSDFCTLVSIFLIAIVK